LYVDREALADKMYIKVSKAIPKKIIQDAIFIICDYLADEMLEGKSISIDNFGTFSTSVETDYFGNTRKSFDFSISTIVEDLMKRKQDRQKRILVEKNRSNA
jgi:nucleoid DNA-binding protein